MLKDKILKIFDKEKINLGSFITYAYTKDKVDGSKEISYHRNGMIHFVDEKYITILNHVGDKSQIKVEDIVDDKIRIIGMADSIESTI